MNRTQAEAAVPVFLAALREAGYPVGDDFAWAAPRVNGIWRVIWHVSPTPVEVEHRAVTLALASVGVTAPCFWCWANYKVTEGLNPCALGDCRAPTYEEAS